MRQPYPPLGTLYAAAVLREAGMEVKLFDSMLANGPEEIRPRLREFRPQAVVIYDDGFNYLTKMCLTNMREAAFAMIRDAKATGVQVIVCSSDATDHYKKYLLAGADFIVMGEGELALKELLQKISEGGDTSAVQGIAYPEGDKVKLTSARPVMRQLDDLPFPAWDLVDMPQYRKMWEKSNGYFSINYATTRGCPFKCNWCAKPIYGNRYNVHSPARVVQELKHLQEQFQFNHVWFCDDIFGLKPGWVQEFARLTEDAGLNFRYKIQSRADLLLKDDTAVALARSGADEVWIGAESGSQKILDAMDKGITVEQIYEAATKLRSYGIKPCFFLQFGYPGETQADIDATLKMLLDLMPYDIGVSVSYPLPGTKFYEKVKADLKEKANWTDSDELALMFRNTYSDAYYKKLQRYIHKRFRKKQGFEMMNGLLRQKAAFSRSNLRRALASFYYIPACYLDKLKLNRLIRA